jgi:hypothetical protein
MTNRIRITALLVALIAAAYAGIAGHGLAAAADSLGLSVPGNQSAGDQYVETLPTTKGPRAPGRKGHGKKLSRDAAGKLQRLGGSDAATLKALATSPALGAPTDGGSAHHGAGPKQGAHTKTSNNGARSRGHGENGRRHGGAAPAVPSAAINTADGGQAGIRWLVLALVAITAVSLAGVGYQRRRHKGTAD